MDRFLVVLGLSLYQLVDEQVVSRIRGPGVIAEGFYKAGPVIEAEVVFQVILFREEDSFFLQHFAEKFGMQRFIIDDDAVEIEDNSLERQISFLSGEKVIGKHS